MGLELVEVQEDKGELATARRLGLKAFRERDEAREENVKLKQVARGLNAWGNSLLADYTNAQCEVDRLKRLLEKYEPVQ